MAQILKLSPQQITYLLVFIFGLVIGTILFIIWILIKKRLENSCQYYIKSNNKLDLWNYIKRNICLYSAFVCYIISISALFILVLNKIFKIFYIY